MYLFCKLGRGRPSCALPASRRRPVCPSPLHPPSSTPPSDTEVVFVFDANLLSFLSTFLSGVDNFVLSLSLSPSPLLSLADPSPSVRPSPTSAQGQKRTKCNPFAAAASSSSPVQGSLRRGRWLPRPIIKLLFSTAAAFWTERTMIFGRRSSFLLG